MNKFGGRKAVMSFLCLVVGAVVVFIKGDLPPNYLMLLQTVIGAFVGGNIAEHWATMKGRQASEVAPAAPVDLSEVNKKLDESAALLVQIGELTNHNYQVMTTLAEMGLKNVKQNPRVPGQ